MLLGNGDGSFKPPMYFSVLGLAKFGAKDNFALLKDVNHDGKLDLIGDWGVALAKEMERLPHLFPFRQR